MFRKVKNYGLISLAIMCATLAVLKFIGMAYVVLSQGMEKEVAWYVKQAAYVVAILSIAVPLYWKGKDDLEEIKDEQQEEK